MSGWHGDFPDDIATDMYDMLAKALMIRAGGSVTLSADELATAAGTQGEVQLHDDGSISLRVRRQ